MSVMLEGVVPLSDQTSTGASVLLEGVLLKLLCIRLTLSLLWCLGVSLPVFSLLCLIYLIIGNDLAGG